jgi:hypothetical protein
MRIATVMFSFLLGLCGPQATWAQTSQKALTSVANIDAADPSPGTDATAPRTPSNESQSQTGTSSDLKVTIYPFSVGAVLHPAHGRSGISRRAEWT